MALHTRASSCASSASISKTAASNWPIVRWVASCGPGHATLNRILACERHCSFCASTGVIRSAAPHWRMMRCARLMWRLQKRLWGAQRFLQGDKHP